MPPTPPPTTISLKIKVPPGYIEGGNDEYTLGSLPVNTSIGAVRQQIQHTVPSNPTPERQRLLYGGRALVDNDQTLADALNTKRDPQQGEYVVHLLVKGDGLGQQVGAQHRRAVSSPASPPPGQQQQQQGLGLPPGLAQQHMQAHQQHMANVQRMQAQQGGFVPPIMPGMPGVPFPQHGGMPPNFAQAIAQGQQQRAAMGVHGIQPQQAQQNGGGQVPAPQGQDGTTETSAQNAAGQQHQPPNGLAHTPLPGQQPHPVARRPVSGQGFHFEGIGPNGQRVQIHQQTLQIPGIQMPGQQPMFGMPPGLPFAQPPMGLFGQPQPQQQQPGVNAGGNALDRARENMAEMRRMLDEMREGNHGTEEQRTRIAGLQERAQDLNDYIDPFGTAASGRRSASPNAQAAQQHAGGEAQPQAQAGQQPQPNRFFRSAQEAQQPQGSSLFGNQRPAGSSLFGNSTNLPQGGGLFGTQPQNGQSLFGNQPAPGTLFGNSQTGSLFAPQGGSLFGQPRPLFGQQWQSTNPDTVSCFLLSGPEGPSALLFSPPHGQYQGQMAMQPTPTTTTATATQAGAQATGLRQPGQQLVQLPQNAAQPGNPPAAPAQVGNAAAAQPGQNAAAQQDPLGPMQPLLNHFWLLFRVLIFAYFLLGSNMGWKRPVALMVIGLGFWMVRAGLFGEGGVLRRWWDDIMRVEGAQRPAQQVEGQQRAGGDQQGPGGQHGQGQGAGQRGMPTPEQVAQRLLRQEDAIRNARFEQIRQYIRPLERAVALFVASLWPGVGEAHVRAQEAEERRRNEEEVARQRAVEEEREKAAAEAAGNAEGDQKKEGGKVEAGVSEAAEGGESADVKEKENESSSATA